MILTNSDIALLMPMHIVMTVNAAWNILNFRRPVVEALLAEGHSVTVFAPRDGSVSLLLELGCSFVDLPMQAKGLNPVEGLTLIRQFRQMLAREQPDIVLSYTIKNNIFGALVANREGVPFVPNVTGLGTAFLSGGLLQTIAETLYRNAFKNLPIVFFQNEDDSGLFLERRLVREEQVRLLPGSGINLQRYAAADFPDREDPAFLLIARLLRDKGVFEFVEAARRVKQDFPEARFQLLGSVGSENRTAIDQDVVQGWVAEEVVEYLGTVPDVRPIIQQSQCVVLPSYREGAPRTLIEAAAMARPLIATDVPGCRAVVDDGETGFLCEIQSADSLAAAIMRFLSLPHAEKQALGQAGRAKMERDYDEAVVVAAYRKAIADLTG